MPVIRPWNATGHSAEDYGGEMGKAIAVKLNVFVSAQLAARMCARSQHEDSSQGENHIS